MNKRPFTNRITFDTADAFLLALSPLSGEYSGEYLPRSWLFRGLSDSTYTLLPSALRPTARFYNGPHDQWCQGVQSDNERQIRAEASTLQLFYSIADQNGLPLPEDSAQNRSILGAFARFDPDVSNKLKAGTIFWPPDELLSLCALAQHHRLPTRLLDWSTSPYVAAYMAACGPACRNTSEGPNICVWVFSTVELIGEEILGRFADQVGISRPRMIKVTAPGAGNPNLAAQSGVLLSYRPVAVESSAVVDVTPYDVLVAKDDSDFGNVFTQLILPARHAHRVMHLLAKMGISGATLFPGFDGVVKSIEEMAHWGSLCEYNQNNRSTQSK